jgi:two-component system LytT family response regulator
MKLLIVDDERKSRETLQSIVNDYCPEITSVSTATNIDEAQKQIAVFRPQIILLDITMPGGNGFELLKRIAEINFEVIFITAHNTFGIEAVKANALDYLLKPVEVEEICQAIQKAIKKIAEKNLASNIKLLLNQLDGKADRSQKITIPEKEGLIFINTEDIVSLVADGAYTQLILVNQKKVLSTRPLKEYENILPHDDFIRVHNSYIINIHHVKYYHRGVGGAVTMTDGPKIIISKRKKKEFLDRFFMD